MALPDQTSTPKATIIGSGQFIFAPGYTGASGNTVEDAVTAGDAVDFGNITVTKFEQEHETAERFSSVGGVKKRDRVAVTSVKISYGLTCDELTHPDILAARLYGTVAATSDKEGYTKITPLNNPSLTGVGTIRIFDPEDSSNPKIIHQDFGCIVYPDGNVEIGTDDFATFDFVLDVTSPDGAVYVKNLS